MKKLLFTTILIFIASGNYALASFRIDNLHVNKPHNGKVTISFNSSEASRSFVYFGESETNLNNYIGNMNYLRRHEVEFSGLKKDTDYYYKIILENEKGRRIESFVNYFNTKGMVLTSSPDILNFQRLDVLDRSIAFSFQSNREVSYEFFVALEDEEFTRIDRNTRRRLNHEIIIVNKLEANSRYNYRLVIRDSDGNTRTYSGRFNTRSNPISNISMTNLKPSSVSEMPSMPERAIFSWQSNVAAKSEIYYGTDPNRLRSKVTVNADLSKDHYKVIENLRADTTYYFQVRMSSPLIRNNFRSQVYSFKTAALNQDFLSLYYQSGDLVSYRSRTYLIYQDSKIRINNSNLVNELKNDTEVKSIEERFLNQYTTSLPYFGVYFSGQVVREENKAIVYLIDGEYKRPIDNWMVFTYLNYKADDILVDKNRNLRAYKTGEKITDSRQITGYNLGALLNNTLVKLENDNTVYLIVNKQRQAFLNEAAFRRHGFSFEDVKVISESELNYFESGQIII